MMAEFRNETVLMLLSAQELALKCKTKAQNIRAQLSAIMVVFFLFLSFFILPVAGALLQSAFLCCLPTAGAPGVPTVIDR